MRNRKFLRMKKKNILGCLRQKVLSERLEKFVFNSNIYEMTKGYSIIIHSTLGIMNLTFWFILSSSLIIRHFSKYKSSFYIDFWVMITKEIEQNLSQGLFTLTFRIEILRGSLFWSHKNLSKKLFFTRDFMQLFSEDTTIFLRMFIFSCTWKHEKTRSQKLFIIVPIFFSAAHVAKNWKSISETGLRHPLLYLLFGYTFMLI